MTHSLMHNLYPETHTLSLWTNSPWGKCHIEHYMVTLYQCRSYQFIHKYIGATGSSQRDLYHESPTCLLCIQSFGEAMSYHINSYHIRQVIYASLFIPMRFMPMTHTCLQWIHHIEKQNAKVDMISVPIISGSLFINTIVSVNHSDVIYTR